MEFGKLLCKIGLHDWSEPRIVYLEGSNVRDVEKYCKRCGKKKKWVEPV
jgi:hypothetical protein